MSLHPDLAAFLELVELGRATGRSRPMHELSVEQAREEFELSALLLDPDPPQATEVTALHIPMRDGAKVPARLYRMPACQAPSPVILYFHGGGYVVGSLDSHDMVCRRLAQATGYAVLAPAYRLAPEYRFPVAVHDALDSARWLSKHAAQWGLDANRMVAAGDSVGATLATLLARIALQGPEAGFSLAAQLLFYPVCDASATYESSRTYAQGYLLEHPTMDWFYQHYLGAQGTREDVRVSPLLADDARPLAPAYVSVAQYDPLQDEGLAYAAFLQRSGTPVHLRLEQGLTHDFLRMSGVVNGVEALYQAAAHWLHQQV